MTQIRLTSIHVLLLLLSTISTVQASDQARFTIEVGVGPLLPYLSGFAVLPISISQSLATMSVGGTDIQVTSDPANMPQNEHTIAINPLNSSRLTAGQMTTVSPPRVWTPGRVSISPKTAEARGRTVYCPGILEAPSRR